MSTYCNLIEPELIKRKIRDDKIKKLKYQKEKHDHENILNYLKIYYENYKKKYKKLNKKKVLLNITEILVGSATNTSSSTMGLINLGAGNIISSSAVFLTSIAIPIPNEYLSKLKISYTKLRDWINVITLLNEKILKQSMMDRKTDEEEAEELKKIYNHYIDKREIMKNNRSEVEHVFSDVISEGNFSQDQKTKPNIFSAKNL